MSNPTLDDKQLRPEKHSDFNDSLNRLDDAIGDLADLIRHGQSGPRDECETVGDPPTSNLFEFLMEGSDRVSKMTERLRAYTQELQEALF